MTERLTQIGLQEIQSHTQEAERLKQAADLLLQSAEHHLEQVNKWHEYLGQLAIPEQRHLTVVRD